MEENEKVFVKRKRTKFFMFVLIVLLILLAGVFVYFNFFSNKAHNYLLESKYYGFKLQTPKNWIAEENTAYSEDYITQLLAACKNDKSDKTSVYEIGAFRFKDQRYPQDLGVSGFFPPDLPSGVILEITVNCIPDGIKSKIINYSYGNSKIGGEKTFEETLNLSGFGETRQISFLHNNFQYKISELVYISSGDKNNEEKLKANYAGAFNKIISSFNFVK